MSSVFFCFVCPACIVICACVKGVVERRREDSSSIKSIRENVVREEKGKETKGGRGRGERRWKINERERNGKREREREKGERRETFLAKLIVANNTHTHT